MKSNIFVILILVFILTNCSSNMEKKDEFSFDLLYGKNAVVDSVLKNKDKFEVQIIYGQIDRDANNNPDVKEYYFNINENYFYPASTVKLITAILALQKINELKLQGINIDKNSTIIFEESSVGHPGAYEDKTSKNGKPSIAHYIKKIFLVSDNDAYNRLYEFCGPKYINEELWKRGFTEARIAHRFFDAKRIEGGTTLTNPFKIFSDDGQIIYEQGETNWDADLSNNLPFNKKGKGFIRNGEYVEGNFDFSKSNYISLLSLYKILKIIIFPELFPEKIRFNLSEDDYRFLYKYMSMYPRESDYPKYEPYEKYFDGYCKFFLFGTTTDTVKKPIRIFNKVGNAYGYSLDLAYIVDFEKKIEFFLAAVVYTNKNQIFNDDKYEYDEIGFPFLAELGKIIYEYEIKRTRKFKPDLTKFNFE